MKKLNYFIIPVITIFVAVAGNYFTSLGLDSWYESLIKPEWTPSGAFIGGMWFFLYLLVTAVVLFFFNACRNSKRFNLIISLFAVNAFLNATWSYLFFGLNNLTFSLFHIIILNLTIIALIALSWKESKIVALGLIPYTGWVTVATYLNYSILILN